MPHTTTIIFHYLVTYSWCQQYGTCGSFVFWLELHKTIKKFLAVKLPVHPFKPLCKQTRTATIGLIQKNYLPPANGNGTGAAYISVLPQWIRWIASLKQTGMLSISP